MKELNPILKRVRVNKETGEAFFDVGGCDNKRFTSAHVGNLNKHFKRKHQEEFLAIQDELAVQELQKQQDGSNQPPAKKKKTEAVLVYIDKDIVIDGCCTLVTSNMRPFKYLEDSGFRMILDPILKALGGKLTISAENIRDKIHDKATVARNNVRFQAVFFFKLCLISINI